MIPMTIAENGEIITLSQIVRIVEVPADNSINVHTADGEVKNYTGKAAAIIRGQALVNVQIFQAWLKQMTSPILPANGGNLSAN